MPRGKKATRSTSGSTNTSKSTTKQQSALSFTGRITKPTAARSTSAKHSDSKAHALERELNSATPTPSAVDISSHDDSTSDAAVAAPTSELVIREQISVPEPELTASDIAAAKITDAQIKSYWKRKEGERTTPRVHQEGLSLHEKVLREFDMSSQFGPCIGVARGRRWRLAEELGLQPPIEVLGVLVKEEKKVNREGEEARTRVQRAYVDELMSSRFVVD